jgi:hypothetical protein
LRLTKEKERLNWKSEQESTTRLYLCLLSHSLFS